MKKWVSDLSSTNFRIFVSILLAVFVVIVLTVVGLVFNRPVQEGVMWAVLGFIGLMLGLDVSQFVFKRKTELVSPPTTTAENARSVIAAETPAPPKPVFTREVAREVAEVAAKPAHGIELGRPAEVPDVEGEGG